MLETLSKLASIPIVFEAIKIKAKGLLAVAIPLGIAIGIANWASWRQRDLADGSGALLADRTLMPQISNNPTESRFERAESGQIAVADYVLNEKTLTVTHVIVPPNQRGRGIASELGAFVVQFARENGFKIRPQCPFMDSYMKRHSETADLRV